MFCQYCGTPVDADAAFCAKCGKPVQSRAPEPANANTADGAGDQARVEEEKAPDPGEPQNPPVRSGDQKPKAGKFKTLTTLLKITLVISALEIRVGGHDASVYYFWGQLGYYIFEGGVFAMYAGLCMAVMHRKNWARKSFIVITALSALSLLGFKLSFVYLLGVADFAIMVYCAYLCFTKEVVAEFRPGDKAKVVRTLGNIIECVAYWIILLAWIFIWCIYIVWCEHGAEDRGDGLAAAAGNAIASSLLLPDPPITITCREGTLSDSVVKIRNDSDKFQVVTVFIYEGQWYDVAEPVSIAPGAEKEFGRLEFRNKWRPKAGNKGFVQVGKYERIGMFELYAGKYRSGFQTGYPDDAPWELKNLWLE